MTAPVWLTIDEVAELLGRPRDTVRGWIARKKNKLPSELRRDDPTKRSVRMIKKTDALKYKAPKMGGKR